MNKIVFFLSLFLFFSCSQEENNDVQGNTNIVLEVPKNITSYFDSYKGDSLTIEIDDYLYEHSLKPDECLPLSLLPVLNDKIPQTQSKTTGAKPITQLKINNNNYFLVVAQQDDYGPIYYGLIYSISENKVKSSEEIAVNWGDAGDSQTIYSKISINKNFILIKKIIETCHADLAIFEGEMIAEDTECKDSTSIIKINRKDL